MLKICIVGTGYVGLVTGTCLAEFGQDVTCMDKNEEKINALNSGCIPIYEPGLEELVNSNVKAGRLHFTTDIKKAVEKAEVIFIAVGTPPLENGDADLSYVLQVASEIGKSMNDYKVIVDKSTVPIGTGKKVRDIVQSELDKRDVEYCFDVVSNPEFLREGVAIEDFEKPDRIVVGVETERAREKMKEVYAALYKRDFPFLFTNLETAELIKYASNAFLAMKISYTNQIAELCEMVGANVLDVAKGMGYDKRIGRYTLHAGAGFGGSCFPKDTRALIRIGEEVGVDISLIKQVVEVNERQKIKMVEKIQKHIGDISGKKIAVLGLSFKPQTDDMREAPAVKIIHELCAAGAAVAAFDPVAVENARSYYLKDCKVEYAQDIYTAAQGAHAVVIVTEWNEFGAIDFIKLKEIMAGNYFLDFRNMYERDYVEKYGFVFEGVGI